MSITSDADICNLALGHLGNFGTVTDIQTPTNDKERTFNLWYDITRKFVLKLMMPNFALTRLIVGKLSETPPFGYGFYYEYPVTALRILGVGNVEDKQNKHNIERTPLGVRAISHSTDFTEGLEIRIVVDIKDVSSYSPEFIMTFSQYLASNAALGITQDTVKAKKLRDELLEAISLASGLNAQENPPIRISRSKFKASRRVFDPKFTEKL